MRRIRKERRASIRGTYQAMIRQMRRKMTKQTPIRMNVSTRASPQLKGAMKEIMKRQVMVRQMRRTCLAWITGKRTRVTCQVKALIQ